MCVTWLSSPEKFDSLLKMKKIIHIYVYLITFLLWITIGIIMQTLMFMTLQLNVRHYKYIQHQQRESSFVIQLFKVSLIYASNWNKILLTVSMVSKSNFWLLFSVFWILAKRGSILKRKCCKPKWTVSQIPKCIFVFK